MRTVEAPAIAPGVPPDYYERIRAVDEDAWWYANSRAIERALLGKRLSYRPRLLDAGCGPGGHLRWAADSGVFASIAGVDLGSQAIGIASARVPEAELHVAPLHDLPFPRGSFDIVVMHDVLQHIPEDVLSASFAEIARVLDASGALVIRTNGARQFRRARADWRLYNSAALRHTIESEGFYCERLTYANMFPVVIRGSARPHPAGADRASGRRTTTRHKPPASMDRKYAHARGSSLSRQYCTLYSVRTQPLGSRDPTSANVGGVPLL